MDVSLRAVLEAVLGSASVLEAGRVLVPVDADGVAAALRIAQEHALPLRLTSGPPAGSDAPSGGAVLSLRNLAAVSVDLGSGVARAEAGAALAALEAALDAAGSAVPGLASPPGAEHVGALVARGRLPRRSLTGIEAVLPGGERVMAGSRVLKDVVGYDVTSLLLGSAGRLAAIVAVHLRLIPAAAVTAAAGVAGPAGPRDVDELAEIFDPAGILGAG